MQDAIEQMMAEANPNVVPPPVSYRLKGRSLKQYVEHVEFRMICAAMQEAKHKKPSKGTITRAAALLGLNRTTLTMKLRKYLKFGQNG